MTEASRSELCSMGDGSGLISRVIHRNTAFTSFLRRQTKISFCKSYELAGSVADVEANICTDPDYRQALHDPEIPFNSNWGYQVVSKRIAMFSILFQQSLFIRR